MTRAAIYVRLSRETEQSSSVERQREDCEQLVMQRGWTYSADSDLYVDNDLSAYTESTDRPEFERLMRNLDDYGALVVWKFDRLYRRFDGATKVMAKVEEVGAELLSVTESLDTSTPIGKAIAGFIAAQAETESDNTSTRVKSAAEWRRRNGYWHGGLIPFGYSKHRTPDGTKLVRNEDEVWVLEEAADRVVEGESCWSVAKDLNERGAPSSGRTEDWSMQSMKFALLNPVMAGFQSTRDEDDERTIVYRDGEPVMVVEGDPILDPDTWHRVCDVFDRRKGSRPSRPNRTLLAGLIECAECHTPMRGNRYAGHYSCRTKYEGSGDCPGNSASLEGVNDLVQRYVKELLPGVALTGAEARAEANSEASGPLVDKLTHLENLEAQQEQELDRLLYEEGRDYEDTAVKRHQKRMAETRDRRDEVQAELDSLRTRQHISELRDMLGDDPVDTFDSYGTDEQRKVLELLLDRVEVSKASRPSSVFDPERVHPIPRTA